MLNDLHRFIDRWNGFQSYEEPSSYHCSPQTFADLLSLQYRNTYYGQGKRPPISISKLGKPVVDVILDSRSEGDELLEGTLKYVLLHGHYTEFLVMARMEDFGLDVLSHPADSFLQAEVDFFGVKGHVDLVVGDVLLDVKAMSASYFNSFTKNPDNIRGYITQLSCYAYAMKTLTPIRHVGFLCINKSTGYMKLVRLEASTIANYCKKAKKAISLYNKYKDASVEDIPVPAPVPETKYGVYTGKLKIPECLTYSQHKDVIYPLDSAGFIDRNVWESLNRKIQNI